MMEFIFLLIFLAGIFSVVLANITKIFTVEAGKVECFYRKLNRNEIMNIKYKVIAAENNNFAISFKLTVPRDGFPPPSSSQRQRDAAAPPPNRSSLGAKVVRWHDVIDHEKYGSSPPEGERILSVPDQWREAGAFNLTDTPLSSSLTFTVSDRRFDAAAGSNKRMTDKNPPLTPSTWGDSMWNQWRDATTPENLRKSRDFAVWKHRFEPEERRTFSPPRGVTGKRRVTPPLEDDRVVAARDDRRDAAEHEVRASAAGDYRFCFNNRFDNSSYKTIHLKVSTYLPAMKKLVVALTVCGPRLNESLNAVKSALVFSRTALHVVLFTESALKADIYKVLVLWRVLTDRQLSFELHDVKYPQAHAGYWKKMMPMCSAQRLFVPDLLPNIDALIYVDTDVLFLGPPDELWSFFTHFGATKVAALVPEHDEVSRQWAWYPRFAKHPFYRDFGVNAGVMLMNLTRLRKFHWTDQVVSTMMIWKRHLRRGDQDIINIIFSYHGARLLELPCQYNFRAGGACTARASGARVLHGNRGVFHGVDKYLFEAVYNAMDSYEVGSDPLTTFLPRLRNNLERASRRMRADVSASSPLFRGISSALMQAPVETLLSIED